jgi:GNAT superfamily N-acetyltransferase
MLAVEYLHADGYTISDDPAWIDRQTVWSFLTTSYWSAGIAPEAVDRAIDNSVVFSLLGPDGAQAGFGRAVTDRARFAWLADVFVLSPHRGRGLGIWLVQTMLTHPDIQGLRVMLGTADAHGLYARFGFRPVDAERLMELRRDD